MIEGDPTAGGCQASRRSRFELAAPRHFLLPAILLLLAEEPRHGYSLAKGLQELRFGHVDRPSVYRALAQLERDGLVGSSPEAPRTGQARRAYSLTDQGGEALRHWMGVIKQERDSLDRVLRRYVSTGTIDAVLAEVEGGWHAVTATPWSPVSPTSRVGRHHGAQFPAPVASVAGIGDRVSSARAYRMRRFRLVADRSVVVIEARSSVGPITFGAIGVTGDIEVRMTGSRIAPSSRPAAHLQLDVDQLRSGNSLYDAELLRRIDARRFPTVRVDLRACDALGTTGRYRVAGEVMFHGVSKALDGTVGLEMLSEHHMVVRGEQVIDIRDFGVVSPTALMLRIYPDVVVKLQVEAELDATLPGSRR